MAPKSLSIIIPVYNEEKTIATVIKKVGEAKTSLLDKEIIVINDGSTDNTLQVLKTIRSPKIRIIDVQVNRGKGNAIKAGLELAGGDVLLVQDADLEYNPDDYPLLLEPILSGKADVVYGSRFIGQQAHRVLYFWHSIGNSFLTLTSNMMTNLNLTDMETGYKVFTREVADRLVIEETRFGFEPEFTAKVAKMKAKIYEVGVSYFGRSYKEGKKINWRDGFQALWCIVKYNLLAN